MLLIFQGKLSLMYVVFQKLFVQKSIGGLSFKKNSARAFKLFISCYYDLQNIIYFKAFIIFKSLNFFKSS